MGYIAEVCAGYGGLGMALGGDPIWYAEIEPGPVAIMEAAHPGVPNLGDITAAAWPEVPRPDVFAAGFPCQPMSNGGLRRHRADPRYLWPYVATGIEATRPSSVFLENVQGITSIDGDSVLREILGDLRRLGYAARWAVLGACAVGLAHHRHRWFCWAEHVGRGAPDPVRVAARCGAPKSGGRVLLPTVRARDWKTCKRPDTLATVATLLPTLRANDRCSRETSPEYAQRVVDNDARRLRLDEAVVLLPTCRASDGAKGGPGQRGSKGDLALPAAVMADRFGRYAEAVALHAEITGRTPPAPTSPNRNGNMRLSPRFAEWLMDIPEGHVTDRLDRVPALKAIGNGVVPRQARAALELLRAKPAQLSLFDVA